MKFFKTKNFARTGSQSGFSLIEIIIVIAIIGTIVGIIVSRISGGKDNADVNLTGTKAGGLYTKLIQYQQEYGKFPTTEQGLDVLLKGTGGVPIAKEDELKDAWGNPFQYRLSGKGPVIISGGKNADPAVSGICYLAEKKLESCAEVLGN